MPERDMVQPIPAGNQQPEHLGDGAFVSHDAIQVWVSADCDGQFNAVALDGPAVVALFNYAKRVGLV